MSISQVHVHKAHNGMVHIVHLIQIVLLDFMVHHLLASLFLRDVFLLHIGQMVNVWYHVHVLKEPTSEVEHVSHMFHAKMDRCGIMI